VMSRLKAWEGALAAVDDSFDGWYLSPEFRTFSLASDEISLQFLDALVRSRTFWERLGGSSKGIGARKERVSSQRFLEQMIWLPPRAEQDAITRLLGTESALTRQALRRVARLAGLREAVLNEVFAALA
jgi:type I restriction enzyme, S subunit